MTNRDPLSSDSIRRSLTGKRRQPKTRLVAYWPNGHKTIFQYRQGAWWWKPSAGSFPQSAAIENAEAEGARVERERL